MPNPPPDTIGLSFLNALEYCPRRFYYEFVQGEMLVNSFVLEGTLLHERADTPAIQIAENGDMRVTHLYIVSEKLGIAGFADVVEEEGGVLVPVEYKHGRQGTWINDHVQLCAQAMCLEERDPQRLPIMHGFIFYFGSRRRVQVDFTSELRAKTRATIARAIEIATRDVPPPPLEGTLTVRCRDCSLAPMCMPNEVRMLRTGGHHADALLD